MTTYLRPLAFVYGPDAQAAIKASQAASLAGRIDIAFTQAEWITRQGKAITRRVVGLDEARNHPRFAAITAARPNFGPLALNTTHIMGIVNVTPDSFSDGGINASAESAINTARQMASDGAAILDIGGESTRPGADEISVSEERTRILPVIKALAANHLVSVDTRKSSLMAEALSAGASFINDVSALRFDLASAATVAKAKAPIILMHAQGDPRTMQLAPKYDDVVLDVFDQIEALILNAEAKGIARARIMIDPGIGFGKSFAQNLELLQQLSLFHALGVGLLVGVSRKGFIGAITDEKTASRRLGGSIGGALAAALQGAQILRVHDVRESFTALQVLGATLNPPSVSI